MAGTPPSKQKGDETVGATGEKKDAEAEARVGAESTTDEAGEAATSTGDGDVKLVNRLAESKSPYVSMSCIPLSLLPSPFFTINSIVFCAAMNFSRRHYT